MTEFYGGPRSLNVTRIGSLTLMPKDEDDAEHSKWWRHMPDNRVNSIVWALVTWATAVALCSLPVIPGRV